MPCIRIDKGFMCGPSGPYEYEGILLELHSRLGPHPIRRRDREPWSRVPVKVWEKMGRFANELDKSKFLLTTGG
jgi:hypothetical protein